MNTLKLKSDIVELVNAIEDELVLYAIRVLLLKQVSKDKAIDFWDELPNFVKIDIQEAIEQADKGEVFSHEEVMKEIKEKYIRA